MAKTTITVEMNDKEYEQYKNFINGDYISKNILLFDFLELQGFKKISSEKKELLEALRDIFYIVYKKGNIRIAIELEGDKLL